MPGIDLEAAHQFWKQYDDPMIYRVIAFMETVEEGWTLDGNDDLEEMLKKLGEQFEGLTSFELGKEDQFVTLLTHLKTSRILRVLQTIDTIDPGSASKLLMYAEENNTPDNVMASLFLKRNIVFERLRLLSRVFSEERIKFVLKVLEQDHD